VDAQGRVPVHSETLNNTEAIQFNGNGDLLTQVIFGDGVFDKVRFIGSRFSYDPFWITYHAHSGGRALAD